MSTNRGIALGALMVLLGQGCGGGPQITFDCLESRECTRDNHQGRCIKPLGAELGWCAFAAQECPITHLRYDPTAGQGLASLCVPATAIDGGMRAPDASHPPDGPPTDGPLADGARQSDAPHGDGPGSPDAPRLDGPRADGPRPDAADGPRLPLGTSCSTADQCASGRCVDGVCCDTACSGACEACQGVGADGTCAPTSLVKVGVERIVPDTTNSGSGPIIWNGSVYAIAQGRQLARLGSDGAYLGAREIVTVNGTGSGVMGPAWNGTAFAMGAGSRGGTSEMRLGLADALGAPISFSTLLAYSTSSDLSPTSLVWHPTSGEYGFTWANSSSGLFFGRIASDGTRIGTDTSIAGLSGLRLVLVPQTGGGYGLSWQSNNAIFFARLDGIGNKVGTDTLVGVDAPATLNALASSGAEFALTWTTTSGELRLARISSDGVRQGADLILDAAGVRISSLAWAGDRWIVAWAQGVVGSPAEIYIRSVSSQGMPLGQVTRVTTTAAHSSYPYVAWAGNRGGLVWTESSDTGPTLDAYFVQVQCN